MGAPKSLKFVWPFTKVAGELTKAATYKLLCDEGQNSGLYVAVLAAVEEFFAATLVWHAQGHVDSPSADDIETWVEGVAAEGKNILSDDYVAEIPANVALRRNLARMHAQMLESARKLKITSEEARDAFCLSISTANSRFLS